MKEYILLYNKLKEDKSILDYVSKFLGDDVIVKDYGIIEGKKVEYYNSIWVTWDKYAYAYAIMNLPTVDDMGAMFDLTSPEDCEKLMNDRISNGYILTE